jgi:hypothetical protein
MFFVYEILDYWYLNIKYYNIYCSNELINLLLLNSINKYHPLLFYSSIFLFIILLGDLSGVLKSKITVYGKQSVILNTSNIKYLFLLTISFTLFLGS